MAWIELAALPLTVGSSRRTGSRLGDRGHSLSPKEKTKMEAARSGSQTRAHHATRKKNGSLGPCSGLLSKRRAHQSRAEYGHGSARSACRSFRRPYKNAGKGAAPEPVWPQVAHSSVGTKYA